MASSSRSKGKAPVYDLTLLDDEVDYRSVTPNVTLVNQVIDLIDDNDEAPTSLSSPAPVSPDVPLLPGILLIQPLSLYWKMIINNKMNIYFEDAQGRRHLTRRLGDKTIVTSSGIHGAALDLTRKDLAGLLMIRDENGNQDGFVNDNVVNAFLQTLDRAVRKAAPPSDHPSRSVFLNSYTASTLDKVANGDSKAFERLRRVLQKHGVNPTNLDQVENIYFPIHIPASGLGHWVLVIWQPKLGAMRWYDSLRPKTGVRRRCYEISEALKQFWAQLAQPSPDLLQDWRPLVVRCLQQQNESDCGVYVLAFCLFRVLGYGRFVTGKGKQNLLRNYFAAVLIQGGWGGELPWGWPSPTLLLPHHYEQEVVPGTLTYMIDQSNEK